MKTSTDDRSFKPVGQGSWSHIPPHLWNDANWQLRNRLTQLSDFQSKLTLSPEEINGIRLSEHKLAVAVTPYFFNLIDPTDPHDPIRRQVIPRAEEMQIAPEELSDPCGEDKSMVAPGLVHRYPDRVLLLITDRCASYCRYCTRSRIVSGVGDQRLETDFAQALAYLRKHTEIHDVLISGGDPLLLSDSRLEHCLKALREIPHIEIVRIGTRVPIFLPQRITHELCSILKRYHPLWINIHTNHPRELTQEVHEALGRLSDAGISMGNQAVLLKGINDQADTLKILFQKLIRARVRPYYLYQCDLITGSAHLRVPIEQGLEIMNQIRGHITGFAVPQYVVDGPGGGGKIPLNPDYILARTPDRIVLRNYKGEIYEYPQHQVPPPTINPKARPLIQNLH